MCWGRQHSLPAHVSRIPHLITGPPAWPLITCLHSGKLCSLVVPLSLCPAVCLTLWPPQGVCEVDYLAL